MDIAWSHYLQVKIQKDLKEKDFYKNEKLINDKNENLINDKNVDEERVNYCPYCGQQLYFCMCSKNKQKLNSKSLGIHIDHS